MNVWKISALAVGAVLAGFVGWRVFSPPPADEKPEPRKVLRSRVIREAPIKKTKKAQRIVNRNRTRPPAPAASNVKVDKSWDPFSNDNDFSMDADFLLEGEVCTEMSKAVRELLDRLGRVQAKFDKKGTLNTVRQLLAMMARGEAVSSYAKIQAIEALKFAGGGILESLPEFVQLAADADPEVSQASLAAIQEMLWDFDTTPRQIADAIAQLVKLTDDPMVLQPFIFEMVDMPSSLKVETSLVILDSGNNAAVEALGDNMAFVYDDFTGAIKTRQDIVQYGKDHPDGE